MRTDTVVIAEQQAAMAKLAMLHGEWRGTAEAQSPEGKVKLVQTERVGPMLDSTALVIEGRGCDDAGKLVFSALAVISYGAASDQYAMQSWSDGRAGKFPFAPADTGFEWSVPLPNGGSTVYQAIVADGNWSEIGSFVRNSRPPIQFVQMNVKRLRDTAGPRADYVPLTD